jgi:hypothetical protein
MKQFSINCCYDKSLFLWGEIETFTKKYAWSAPEDATDYVLNQYDSEDDFIEAVFLLQDRGFNDGII